MVLQGKNVFKSINMKADDLMRGDYVLHNGNVIKVAAVHKRKIGYHERPDRLTWLFENQFEPIEVTKEILIKNNFEFNELDNFCWITDNTYWEDGEVRTYEDAYICEGKYVHQLQHLFSLTPEKHKIKYNKQNYDLVV